MSKLQIGIVGVVLAGSLAAPLIMEYRSQAQLREARTALKARTDELAAQAAENQRLSTLLAQTAQPQQLNTSEGAELLRLRSEVGALHQQTNDLAKLQAANERLRAGAGRTSSSPATTQDKADHEYIQKESWAFVGFADPESAFQSAVWAMSRGEAKTFLSALSPEGEHFKDVESKTESELAAENKREMEKVTAYKILDKEPVSDSEVLLTIYAQGENALTRFKLQRLGDEWKLVGPVKGK